MSSELVAAAARDPLERLLEGAVLEGLDLAAVVADEVVVMFAERVHPFEPGHSVAEVHSLYEP